MRVEVTTGNENQIRLDGGTFRMVLDPSQQAAFNQAMKDGFAMLIEAVGKETAHKVYRNTIVKLTEDNSYWSRNGKWLRKSFSYILENS
jgi:hypothetical protein